KVRTNRSCPSERSEKSRGSHDMDSRCSEWQLPRAFPTFAPRTPAMATESTSTLTRTATVIGRGLLFLARHLLALLVAASRFIVLRAIPATWRWLRSTAFPALGRFYRWLPHRRVVV